MSEMSDLCYLRKPRLAQINQKVCDAVTDCQNVKIYHTQKLLK